MPTSRAVDQVLEDWYCSEMRIRKWPLENHLLHAARFCDGLVRQCELALELKMGNGRRHSNTDIDDGDSGSEPAARVQRATISDDIQGYLVQTVEDAAFELVMSGGRASFDYDEATELVLHRVRERLYATAVQCARERNAGTCRSIPPEVLYTIFTHAPFRDRLAATQVCSFWRAAARGAPRLWCDLVLFARKTPSWDQCMTDFEMDRIVVQQFLALSKGLPLSLAVHGLRPWHVIPCHSPLAEHLPRMRHLELHLAGSTAQKTAGMMMQVLSKNTAPLLESFVLGTPDSPRPSIPIDYRIFGGTAPGLTEVELLSCTLGESRRWTDGAFASVRKLRTPYTTGTAVARATQHLHLLRVFPRLTTLSLYAVDTGAMLPFIDPDTALRNLTLHVTDPGALLEMLDPPHGRRAADRMRDHTHVKELSMVFPNIVCGAALRAATRDMPPWTHITFYSNGAARVCLSVWCGPDRVRHVAFQRSDDELRHIVDSDELFAGAHVEEGWKQQLSRCRHDLLGRTLDAIDRRFSSLPIGRRPVLSV